MAGELVKFGDWISEGWKLFTMQWQTWVLASVFHLIFILIIVGCYLFGITLPALSGGEPNLFMLVPILIAIPIFLPVSVFLSGGMHRMAQKQLRGETISLKDVFSCTDCFGRLLIAAILTGIAAFIGTMLCLFPGYIVMAMLFFTVPIIVDKNVGAVEALQQSYELVKRDWLMFTLFVFVVNLIAGIGANLCIVGILVTAPLLFTITAVAYRDCFGMEGAIALAASGIQPDTPYIYRSPAEGNEVHARQNPTCPHCASFMPVTATFCPKCGLKP